MFAYFFRVVPLLILNNRLHAPALGMTMTTKPCHTKSSDGQFPPTSSQQLQKRRRRRPSNDEILSWDLLTLSDNLQRSRTVTCVDIMTATIERVQQVNPAHNAIIMMKPIEELMTLAKEADDQLSKLLETNTNTHISRLFGVPTAIKDVSNVQGFPTTNGGSPLFDHHRPCSTNDVYVENMIANAGMIVVGKTNVPECALGSNTFNPVFGATLNTFDARRTAGGSSGGAAVAIATGMLLVADGTDNMGSLRNPAGWNNIYSLRPTAGLIPDYISDKYENETNKRSDEVDYGGGENQSITKNVAMEVLGHPASTPGPMARNPLDCAILLETMVGGPEIFDAVPLITVHQSRTTTKTEILDEPVRIGWLRDWGGSLPFEEGILEQCEKALSKWNKMSSNQFEIVRIDRGLFPFEKLWDAYNTIRYASTFEKYSAMENFDLDGFLIAYRNATVLPVAIKEELAWELDKGSKVTKADLDNSQSVHEKFDEWFQSFLDEHKFNAVALPSAQVWPFSIEIRYPEEIAGCKMATYHQWMSVSIPVSLAGIPCVTIPAGFGRPYTERPEDNEEGLGLPMGIQLFSKRGADSKLLFLALHHYESTTANVGPMSDGTA